MRTLRTWLCNKIYHIAYPCFDCENCIGMIEYGCYCIAVDAGGPGVPPTKTQKVFRWIYKKIC